MIFPLSTPRLTLAPLDQDDIATFVAYRRLPEVARYQVWDTEYPRERAEALVAEQAGLDVPAPGEWVQIAIRGDRDGTGSALLGDIALHTLADQPDTYELGCTLDPAAQGHGYALEAVQAVLHELFVTLGAHRVIATCDTRNTASTRVLARLGMRQESHLLEADWFKDEWTTVDAYAMLRHEYAAATAAPAEAASEG